MIRMLAQGVLVLLVAACSGATQNADPGGNGTSGPSREAEARFAAQQAAMCEAMCTRTTACALEDARATMPPDQVKELEQPEILAANTNQCKNECVLSEISMRQIKVAKACSDADGTCAELFECLKAANKQSAAGDDSP